MKAVIKNLCLFGPRESTQAVEGGTVLSHGRSQTNLTCDYVLQTCDYVLQTCDYSDPLTTWGLNAVGVWLSDPGQKIRQFDSCKAAGRKIPNGSRHLGGKESIGGEAHHASKKTGESFDSACLKYPGSWRVVMFRSGPEATKPRLFGSASRAQAEPPCGPEPAFGSAWHSSKPRPSRKAAAFSTSASMHSRQSFKWISLFHPVEGPGLAEEGRESLFHAVEDAVRLRHCMIEKLECRGLAEWGREAECPDPVASSGYPMDTTNSHTSAQGNALKTGCLTREQLTKPDESGTGHFR
ncbi:hypothetical protein C8R45DRAFT_941957 [Mycena sanguinolenta]|nr:hypothetical protein C8R45DRAFT_941957 [Mycena sanguinolenta]